MRMLIQNIKLKNLNHKIKPLCSLFILSVLCSFNLNCGKRKPPQPPIERVLQRVSINGTQIGNQIRLVWQMPARNADDGSLLNIRRAEVYRLAEPLDSPLSLTQEEFSSRSTLIASILIKDSDFALSEMVFKDKLQFAGQEARLRYAIRFVNSSGQKAAFSNFLVIQPSSRIALNPTELSSLVSQNQILVSWLSPTTNVDGSKPPNVLGFNIYRTDSKNETRRLNNRPSNSNSFKDVFFKFGQQYKYFVRTVSVGTNGEEVESISSDSIKVTPIDTFPPEPPSAITIASAPNTISIFFAINIERDVEGYKIYRTTTPNEPKNNWKLLTKEPLKANTYQDNKVESGKIYYYYLKAIDKFGNESTASLVVSETAL